MSSIICDHLIFLVIRSKINPTCIIIWNALKAKQIAGTSVESVEQIIQILLKESLRGVHVPGCTSCAREHPLFLLSLFIKRVVAAVGHIIAKDPLSVTLYQSGVPVPINGELPNHCIRPLHIVDLFLDLPYESVVLCSRLLFSLVIEVPVGLQVVCEVVFTAAGIPVYLKQIDHFHVVATSFEFFLGTQCQTVVE